MPSISYFLLPPFKQKTNLVRASNDNASFRNQFELIGENLCKNLAFFVGKNQMIKSHFCTSDKIVIETNRPRHMHSVRFPFEISDNRQKLKMTASGRSHYQIKGDYNIWDLW